MGATATAPVIARSTIARNRRNRTWSTRDREDWRRREETSWRQRQNDWRRRENERDNWWRQRQQQIQNQRRQNYWRLHQRYLERLRRDRDRRTRFVYVNVGSPTYQYYRSNQYYYVNQYGADMLRRAIDLGYEEGYRAAPLTVKTVGVLIIRTQTLISTRPTVTMGTTLIRASISTTSARAFVVVTRTAITAVINTANTQTGSTVSSSRFSA